jgi:DNA-binding beta-propeller fold protein YncE
MHDIRYNPVADEIVVGNPFARAILTFRGGANGQEPPIRVIQGPNTQQDGGRVAVDPVHREIYAPASGGGIVVFPHDAQGDVAPIRAIRGPDTQLGGSSIAVDPVNNLIAVAGERNGEEGLSIVVFDRTANGNVKPRNVISGPNSQLPKSWINQLQILPEQRLVGLAVLPERNGAILMEPTGQVFIGFWSLDANGDVPPKWKIYGGDSRIKLTKPFGLDLNPAHREIYVSDMRLNGVLTFSFPELFESRVVAGR